jgi:formate-dependent nitrite reductase membrane component NrfD
MAIILSTLGTGLLSQVATALKVLMGGEQVLVVIEGVVLYLFLSQRYRVADQGKDSVRLLLFGEMRLLFWGGIVVLGFVFPVVLEYLYSYFPGHPVLLFATGLFLLSGGFFLRMAVLASGVKEQLPMHKYIEMKYQLGAVKKSTSPEP